MKYKNIGIMGRAENSGVIKTIERIVAILTSYNIKTFVDNAVSLENKNCISESVNIFKDKIDLMIVVGGDGSVLGAARDIVDSQVPLIGVNRGHLGFLTDISPDTLSKDLEEILFNTDGLEERFMLEGSITNNHSIQYQGIALNDIVLQPGQITRMLEFSITINGKYVCTQKADGLIISTPTGSTAYALSAGGSILEPSLDVIGIVPINPHTLSNRPFVVPANSDIEIKVSERFRQDDKYPQLTFDGQNIYQVEGDNVINIKKYKHTLKLLHLKSYNYYEICRTKLGWTNSFVK